MKITKIAVSLFVVGLLALTGCSSTEAVSADPPKVESATAQETAAENPEAEAAAEESKTSPRGNLIKAVGEGAGVTNSNGDTIAEFVVNSIEVDGVCNGDYPAPAENGHMLILDVSITTYPELADPESIVPTFNLNPYLMKVVAPNGTTSNAELGSMASYTCLPDAEEIPQDIGPAENVTGKLALDSEVPNGTLIITPMGSSTGWEFEF